MYVAQPLVLIVYNIYFTAATLLLFIMFLLTLHIGYAYFSTTRTLSTRARPRAQPPRARLDSRAVNTRYLLCSLRFMPDDVMLTSVVCPVHVVLAVAVIILVGALARYTLGGGAVQGFVSSAS